MLPNADFIMCRCLIDDANVSFVLWGCLTTVILYMENYALLIGWKQGYSYITRVQSYNTSANYK